MLETYKSRCCASCRFARQAQDGSGLRCGYYENERAVAIDDTCSGWECCVKYDNGLAFQKPVESTVVNTYDVSMRITVRGNESRMRYAESVKAALQDFADCEMDESEMGGEYTVLHVSVDHVRVHDPGAEP